MTFKQFCKQVFMMPLWVLMGDFSWVSAIAADKAANKQTDMQLAAMLMAKKMNDKNIALNQPFYDAGLPAFETLAAAIKGGIDPNTGRTWTPTESSAFKYNTAQSNADMERRLRAMGRNNSTFGDQAFADNSRKMYSSEFDKQLGRLGDLTNIARGGASNLSNLNSKYSDDVTKGLGSMSDTLAGSLLAQSMMGGKSLSSLGSLKGLSGLFGSGGATGGLSFDGRDVQGNPDYLYDT